MSGNFLEEAYQLFGQIIARASQLTLQAEAKRSDVLLDMLDAAAKFEERPEMQSRVFMAGGPSSISIVHYFDTASALELAAPFLKQGTTAEREALAMDFMSEFSNLHGGVVRKVVQELDFKLKTTLPMAMNVPQRDFREHATGARRTRWELQARNALVAGEATIFGFKSLALCPNPERMMQILKEELVDLATKSTVEIFDRVEEAEKQ